MKIVKRNSAYRKNGNIQFTYIVEGTAAELKQYKEDKGEYYRENDAKQPLHFSQDVIANDTTMVRTTKGNWVVDNLEDKAVKLDDAANKNEGKIIAISRVLGISKREAAMMMLEA